MELKVIAQQLIGLFREFFFAKILRSFSLFATAFWALVVADKRGLAHREKIIFVICGVMLDEWHTITQDKVPYKVEVDQDTRASAEGKMHTTLLNLKSLAHGALNKEDVR